MRQPILCPQLEVPVPHHVAVQYLLVLAHLENRTQKAQLVALVIIPDSGTDMTMVG